ncbi:hypothetical protein Moror_6420 [Moniliophthora roreri MCA 2997]|uniref:EF-hand domain-containing protein n=2 Tax=Moniliophthora roreri TaxID=221103 RepID=V2XSV5_MONRO|nr:hypothetical protein Moror_6420 [Moniliophthora roreri MCA 2997]
MSSALLDSEGSITESFESVLKHIFLKYATPSTPQHLESAVLFPENLDKWATDTNGQPFTQETKDELLEFMDCDQRGCLTWKGFLQVYQLQTENDEEETWRDLARHGFDRSLKLSGS